MIFSFKKISISAAAAAILITSAAGFSAMSSSAEAAKAPKIEVCHYQAEDELLLDDVTGEPVIDELTGLPIVIDPAGWRVINISMNAMKAHLGDGGNHLGHGDVDDMDELLADVGTEQDCLDRNL